MRRGAGRPLPRARTATDQLIHQDSSLAVETPSRGLRVDGHLVRRCLGALWLADGTLQLQPFMYRRAFVTSVLAPNAAGQPDLVAHSITWAAGVVGHHLVVTNTAFAAVQLLIGVALLYDGTPRLALAVSVAWGAAVWWLGEGIGLVLTGHASPLAGAPGAVILYVAIAVLVWPKRAGGGEVPPNVVEGGGGGRAVWAVLWGAMAALWVLPANLAAGSIRDTVATAVSGEPAWLSGALLPVARSAQGHGVVIAACLAAASVVIGLGVLTRHPGAFLAAGAGLSMVFWVFGQSFGGLLTGQATDVGTGPLVALLALAVLPGAPRPVPRTVRHSLAPAWAPR